MEYLSVNLPWWGWFTLVGGVGRVHRRTAINSRCRDWRSFFFLDNRSSSRGRRSRRWRRRSRWCRRRNRRSRCSRWGLCLRGRGGWYICRRWLSDIGQQRVLLSRVQRPDQLWPRWRRSCVLGLLAPMFGVSCLILKVVYSLHKKANT